jgi:hypothetical protein
VTSRRPPQIPLPIEELELRGHLFIHHSLHTTETVKQASLFECHEEEHADPRMIEHPHAHSAPAIEEEWSWD